MMKNLAGVGREKAMEKCCKNCKYFSAFKQPYGNGYCRRFTEGFKDPDWGDAFHKVQEWYWCDEFK